MIGVTPDVAETIPNIYRQKGESGLLLLILKGPMAKGLRGEQYFQWVLLPSNAPVAVVHTMRFSPVATRRLPG